MQWSPDGSRFISESDDGTDLRDASFQVIRSFPQLRRAAWLDASQLIGYQSRFASDTAAFQSNAAPVIVDVATADVQTIEIPYGLRSYPMSNGHGWALIGETFDRRDFRYIAWSLQGSTERREGLPHAWSNDGTELALTRDITWSSSWPEVVSWPADATLYKDETVRSYSAMDFDPTGRYISLIVSSGPGQAFRALRIVDLRGNTTVDIPIGDANVSSFWTNDSRQSIVDLDSRDVRAFEPNGMQVNDYVAPFPDAWASDDGSTLAFFDEADMTAIAVTRNGITRSVETPNRAPGSVYFSPDGSVLMYWTETDPVIHYLLRL